MKHRSDARPTLRAVLTASITAVAFFAPVGPATGIDTETAAGERSARSDRAGLQTMSIPDTGARDTPLVAELEPATVRDFGLVAVTWDHGTAAANTRVSVRNRVAGAWTPWQDLGIEPDEGPSAAEESSARDGTAPLWVGRADAVAVRVTAGSGSAPEGLRVVTVASAPDVADGGATDSSFRASSGRRIKRAPAFPSIPDIVTRDRWGADPKLGDACWDPVYGSSAKMVFIHHTVNSNDYAPSDGAAILRSIQAYHTQGRGWCDIGYNFLVDRFGTIYEGRRGGLRLPVRGAHSGDYNTNSVGISMIGNFDEVKVPAAMKNAVIRLVGWRLGTSYMPVRGTVMLNHQRFDRISGHRDAMATTCPGQYGYSWLAGLRHRVHSYLGRFRSAIEAKGDRLGRAVTGAVFVGENKVAGGRHTKFRKGAMWAKPGLGTHWLSGRPLRLYRSLHGTSSPLGFPRSDLRETAVSRVGTVAFEKGRMFVGPRSTPRALWGRVLRRYTKLGSITGNLGLPTSSIAVNRVGERATFQQGSISWDRETDLVTVVYR